MQVKELEKFQFLVTVTPSEHLIIDGYSKIFNTTLQAAALVMCVRGWTSYAQLMMQYCKNVRVKPSNPETAKLLEIERHVLYNSNEAKAFREAMRKVADSILETEHGKSDTVAG